MEPCESQPRGLIHFKKNSLVQKVSFFTFPGNNNIFFFTPLYEKGIKENQKRPMETTARLADL